MSYTYIGGCFRARNRHVGGQIIIYASKASDFTFSILFIFSTLFRSMLAAMTLVGSTNA